MKSRLLSNWRTSLLGAFLLLISLLLVFNKIITWSEFMAFLPTIFGLLYVKDTIFQVNPNSDSKTISLLLLLLLSSCSPQHRLTRLIALHPELKVPDTIVIRDSLIVPQVRVDTMLDIKTILDTVIIQKDRLQIKLSRIHDTLFVSGKCKGDTVYITRKIPVEKIKIVKADKIDNLISKLPWIVIGLICLILLFVFNRYFPKR